MKVKIAYLCSSDSWGGLEMNHLRNAEWMKNRGHQVLIVGLKNSKYIETAIRMKLNYICIEKHKKYYDFKKGGELAKLLSNNKVSHLFIRSTYDMSIAATVKSKLKDKIATAYFMEMQLGVKKTNFLHSLRFNFIDVWSTPLEWLAKQVKTMTHYKGTLVTIPSGLELKQFEVANTQLESRKALSLPEGLIFGLIGRFDKAKGQLMVLEAMKKAKNNDFHLVLLGEPTRNEGDDYHQKILTFITKNELEDRISVLPFMDETVQFYNSIDWLIMATKAETFGMVTIEALASGRPVLGSNKGGTPEILNKEKGGLLFESMSSTNLAKKIDYIIDNNIKFNSSDLQLMSKVYDHSAVCQSIEKQFNLK